jgi:hypothetical protein
MNHPLPPIAWIALSFAMLICVLFFAAIIRMFCPVVENAHD